VDNVDDHQIEDPLLGTMFLSEEILSHGEARSKIQLPNQLQKQNIMLWQ